MNKNIIASNMAYITGVLDAFAHDKPKLRDQIDQAFKAIADEVQKGETKKEEPKSKKPE